MHFACDCKFQFIIVIVLALRVVFVLQFFFVARCCVFVFVFCFQGFCCYFYKHNNNDLCCFSVVFRYGFAAPAHRFLLVVAVLLAYNLLLLLVQLTVVHFVCDFTRLFAFILVFIVDFCLFCI